MTAAKGAEKRKMTRITLLFPFILFPAVALADWSKGVGQWTIRTEENGCLLSTVYADDTYFSLALSGIGEDLQLYTIIFNDSWEYLEDGAAYSIGMDFVGAGEWSTEFIGWKNDVGTFLIYAESASSAEAQEYVQDFVVSEELRLQTEGEAIGSYSLQDSHAAFQSMLECHAEFAESANGSR